MPRKAKPSPMPPAAPPAATRPLYDATHGPSKPLATMSSEERREYDRAARAASRAKAAAKPRAPRSKVASAKATSSSSPEPLVALSARVPASLRRRLEHASNTLSSSTRSKLWSQTAILARSLEVALTEIEREHPEVLATLAEPQQDAPDV